MYTPATAQDIPGITALWQQVYGDGEAFIQSMLQGFAGPGQVYVARDEAGTISAVLSAVPCTAGTQRGIYLYALATRPESRQTGLMTGLIQYAEQAEADKGAAFACLIPAGLPLFAYYQKRGYTLESRLRRFARSLEPNLLASAQHDTLTVNALLAERHKHMAFPYVSFDAPRTALVLADLYAGGVCTLQSPHGYALYFVNGAEALVAELMADSTPAATLLLQAIREKHGCETATLTLAENAGVFAGEGRPVPHALFKRLAPGALRGEVPYLRFGFEEPNGFGN